MSLYEQETQLEKCRSLLIDALPGVLSAGNCFITSASQSIKGFGRLYVELFDDGASYDDEMRSDLFIRWTLGIAIRTVLNVDQMEKFLASSKELRTITRRVRNALHLHYDAVFPEPPKAKGHSAVRPSDDGTGGAVVELKFSMLSIESYEQVIGT